MLKTILFINIRSHKVERVKPFVIAKKLGFRIVLVADKDPKIDKILYDDLIITDTYNYNKTLEEIEDYNKKYPLSGVFTWSDKDVELVSKVGKKLSLPSLSETAAKKARNKFLMRKALSKVEGLCPKFQSVKSLDDLKEAADKIGFPAIFKPVGASGSKAIFKITNDTDLDLVYYKMKKSTEPIENTIYSYYPSEYIYESFVEGVEVSVDGVIKDGIIYIAGVTDKNVTDDYSLEYTAFFPSKLSEVLINEIKEKTKEAINALELDNCPFHLECKVNKTDIKILEVAARPGGGFITSHLIELASSISLHEQIIRMLSNEEFEWIDCDKVANKYAGQTIILSTKEGIIKKIQGIDLALEDENIKFVIPIKESGDEVLLPPKNYAPFLAFVIAQSSTYKTLTKSLNNACDKINFEVDSNL